ncbi:hypothetical protein [Streptomyces agglomeratus]|uniref:hypothetical protein n=1 Tax=Streptomyces agglomeratus TaxID=285458 RepID=UPI000AEAF7B9|nr:hypothetical protein [Streptomyces agglomeratus]
MTSSSESAKLILISRTPGTLLTVFDSTLRRVAAEHGTLLELVLPPGLYRIQGRLGGTETTQLISLAPGTKESRDLTVHFAAAAPADGTSTADQTHGALAFRLSDDVAQGVGPDAGAVLVLRNLHGLPTAPLAMDRVSLLDRTLRPVAEWYADWAPASSGGAVGRCGRFPPGPYVLRTVRNTADDAVESTDQTIWLSSGWQTLVFIPNESSGPDARGLSVQMVPLKQPWSPEDAATLAVEAALTGLREGPPSIPPDLAGLLLGSLDNPMLGILCLHTLLLDNRAKVNTLRRAIANVEHLLWPPHPDVLAASSTLGLEERRPTSVPWPPMLASSYRQCLLPADLKDGRVLPAGSPSERVASFLRPSGPWLQWASTSDLLTARYADAPYAVDVLAKEEWVEGAHVHVTAGPGRPEIRAPHAAVTQVERVVADIAGFQNIEASQLVEDLGTRELARRCGLPETLVIAALHKRGLGQRGAPNA